MLASNALIAPFYLPDSFLNLVNSSSFPWCYVHRSTSEGLSFMGHTLVHRKDEDTWSPNSPYWPVVYRAFVQFCEQNHILFTSIERCAMNLTFEKCGRISSDAHVDKTSPHKVLIVYLNSDCTGDTVIYKDKYEPGSSGVAFYGTEEFNAMQEVGRVSPERNKAVLFDGANYHAAEFPSAGQRRIVLVMNFL